MKEYEDKMEKFLKHEWDEEVKQMDEEPLPDSDLYETAPAQMKEELMRRIAEYEREKAYEHLTEEDKEAIRLGRELLAQQNAVKTGAAKTSETTGSSDVHGTSNVVGIRDRSSGGKKKNSKWKKVYILVASVAVLVLGLGMTSIGGKRYLIEAMKQVLGERELVQVDSKEEDKKESGIDSEEAAYQEVKDELGFDPIKLHYRPKGLNFIEAEIDKTLQCATLFYEGFDESLFYNMNTNYADGAFGFDTEDGVLDEYELDNSDLQISIREYRIDNSDKKKYVAKFEYNNIQYLLDTDVEKDELEKILRNLYFN